MAIKFLGVKYKEIFENLNLNINKNEIISVVGKNGSGKTTFLNLIYGLDKNFEGKITIGRKSFDSNTKNKDIEKTRLGISYLIQNYEKQLFNINILEDIKYGVDNIDINILKELIKNFGMDEKILKKSYFEISNSEKKKILLIKIFIMDSKIILLDDPTNGLDQKGINTLVKILKKEKRKDKIIIITSQDCEFLLRISDRILAIENNKLIEYENKYEFFSNQVIINNCKTCVPNVLEFRQRVLNKKNVKLVYRDNVNDLLKDIYRNVK